jgi:glycosyltransferase involved in cell wall biosynthesis
MPIENRNFFTIFFIVLSVVSSIGAVEEKPLVVLITSYNNEHWIDRNLSSVASQKYSNFRLIYIEDCSTDHTADLAKNLIAQLGLASRSLVISNTTRQGALANIYHAVQSCKDDEIIVSLDGDDWFAHTDVLRTINEAYSKFDIWLTHGTFKEYPYDSTAWSVAIPEPIVKNNLFRTYRCPSHLRTFYAWLFKKIDVNDLLYENRFFPMTWDQAIMFPMIEMAGERHLFIKDVLYIYNMSNDINDNKVNPPLQNELESIIRSMPPYQLLEKRPH